MAKRSASSLLVMITTGVRGCAASASVRSLTPPFDFDNRLGGFHHDGARDTVRRDRLSDMFRPCDGHCATFTKRVLTISANAVYELYLREMPPSLGVR